MFRSILGLTLFIVVGIISFPERLLALEITYLDGGTYSGDTLKTHIHTVQTTQLQLADLKYV